MKVPLHSQIQCVQGVADSWSINIRHWDRRGREERGRRVTEFVVRMLESGEKLTRKQLRAKAYEDYETAYAATDNKGDTKFGSAILTFLAFQLIWYFIKKYILDDWFENQIGA